MSIQDNLHTSLRTEKATVEYVEPSFEVHNFTTSMSQDEGLVCIQVLKMENSLFVWIGSQGVPTFQDLSVAMNTSYDRLPLISKLMGGQCDSVSSNLSSKLSKKLGITVYVSFNLPSEDRIVIENVEKMIQEEIRTHPGKFHSAIVEMP